MGRGRSLDGVTPGEAAVARLWTIHIYHHMSGGTGRDRAIACHRDRGAGPGQVYGTQWRRQGEFHSKRRNLESKGCGQGGLRQLFGSGGRKNIYTMTTVQDSKFYTLLLLLLFIMTDNHVGAPVGDIDVAEAGEEPSWNDGLKAGAECPSEQQALGSGSQPLAEHPVNLAGDGHATNKKQTTKNKHWTCGDSLHSHHDTVVYSPDGSDFDAASGWDDDATVRDSKFYTLLLLLLFIMTD